jgi:hypothetical protein
MQASHYDSSRNLAHFVFIGRPAEEAALVLQDGLSATMEMLLLSSLLLLFICSSIGGLEGDLCRGKLKN